MDSIVLAPLPFQVDVPRLLARLHIRESHPRAEEIRRLVDQAEAIARPKAIYKIGFIDSRDDDHVVIDGLKFSSRILRVNLEGQHRVFPFICTSGRELESWAEGQEDLAARFWADAVNQAVLGGAVSAFDGHLRSTYGLDQASRMQPGSLADWPLAQQRVLFTLLGDTESAIGVKLTDTLLMIPTKSVSGIVFATTESFASCQLCPRDVCPNRRTPYDAELLARKYQRQA